MTGARANFRSSARTDDVQTAETEALLAQAADCAKRGELGQAEKLVGQVLARDSRHPAALAELGRIAYLTGNKRGAADCLRKAIASRPDNAPYHNQLGTLLVELGERQQAIAAFTRALEIDPRDADVITNVGIIQLGEGRLNEALAAFRRALEINPVHLESRVNLGIALRNAVPPWHFPMMNDAPRNEVYDAAIRRVVPGRSVLDIGTGGGLLAMMAARAGARWVVSCELVHWIAAKAREVVAANGLGERIRIIDKRSYNLQIGPDLPERADVLIMEVFGSQAINEQVIPVVTHAHAQLLQPGATVVPNAASIHAYLAAGPTLEGYFFVDRAVGFTAAAFNDFAQPNMGLQVNCVPHDVLSDDFEVFRFDLTRPPNPTATREIDVVATRPGRCFGVVQWIRLDLGAGLLYENRPGPNATIDGWGHMLHHFSRPIWLNAGDRLRLMAQHNRDTLMIWDLRDSG
jgi:type II protein arginine methyltransferase